MHGAIMPLQLCLTLEAGATDLTFVLILSHSLFSFRLQDAESIALEFQLL